MSHKWMDSYYNNCCSCGWRCSKNSTGTHTRHECKDEYAEHLERAAREHTQDERLKPKPWVPENEVGCGGPMSEPKVAACREWQKEVLDGPNKIPGWSIQLPEKLAAFVASRIAQARLEEHEIGCLMCLRAKKGQGPRCPRAEYFVRQLAEHVREAEK